MMDPDVPRCTTCYDSGWWYEEDGFEVVPVFEGASGAAIFRPVYAERYCSCPAGASLRRQDEATEFVSANVQLVYK